ncbi:putative dehydrogenase [Litorivivens lipolytica]|uniref:Putative dehydrogenase n=1 Tax=Litorivivens lipolytica TaxID=1524264 RepID=A0A7W4Z660_9GAMM|nr:Gfo/Idh/MocA family oxidoreductase [Litorivivens lipolytica]MBB3047913.1 putative dehydrogenase [Litorivivens lipolytica]
MTQKVLRIGVLGAARITPMALVSPARENPQIELVGIAARDVKRAQKFAAKHGLTQVFSSYEELLASPDIDAIYNPLPNGLHGHWTIAALEAGKHVLCEKPFTANAEEAERVAEVARRSGLVVMEAFHYRYHALTARMLEIIASGELGELRHVKSWMHIPLVIEDIRWDYRLAGGTLMDVGCYAIHLLRTLAGQEPEVASVETKLKRENIDRRVDAEFTFPGGFTGEMHISMLSRKLIGAGAEVTGSLGSMRVFNPIAPQLLHRLTVTAGGKSRKETVPKQPSSYAAQLQAFADAVLDGAPFPTTADDAIANMKVIDACYRTAGLPLRQPTPV